MPDQLPPPSRAVRDPATGQPPSARLAGILAHIEARSSSASTSGSSATSLPRGSLPRSPPMTGNTTTSSLPSAIPENEVAPTPDPMPVSPTVPSGTAPRASSMAIDTVVTSRRGSLSLAEPTTVISRRASTASTATAQTTVAAATSASRTASCTLSLTLGGRPYLPPEPLDDLDVVDVAAVVPLPASRAALSTLMGPAAGNVRRSSAATTASSGEEPDPSGSGARRVSWTNSRRSSAFSYSRRARNVGGGVVYEENDAGGAANAALGAALAQDTSDDDDKDESEPKDANPDDPLRAGVPVVVMPSPGTMRRSPSAGDAAPPLPPQVTTAGKHHIPLGALTTVQASAYSVDGAASRMSLHVAVHAAHAHAPPIPVTDDAGLVTSSSAVPLLAAIPREMSTAPSTAAEDSSRSGTRLRTGAHLAAAASATRSDADDVLSPLTAVNSTPPASPAPKPAPIAGLSGRRPSAVPSAIAPSVRSSTSFRQGIGSWLRRVPSSATTTAPPGGARPYLTQARQLEKKMIGQPGGAAPPARKGRRMSLGAALMMPPAPRVNERTLFGFTFNALGILYGDLAAGPMFLMKSAFHKGISATNPETHILGTVSFMIWISIVLGVIKYCLVVLKADNNGEGGMLALFSLVPQPDDDGTAPFLQRHYDKIFMLALLGCAFLLGDGLVTPAICVLAAIEGFLVIEAKNPGQFAVPVSTWRVPVTCVLLVPLFYVQRFGLGSPTKVFPYIMMIWFAALAAIGLWNIVQIPWVLKAFNPWTMISVMYLLKTKATLELLSTVVLVVAGLEFLYADLGTFKRRPISLSFSMIVVPCTLLSYLGQAATLLGAHDAHERLELVHNLFFEAAPDWALWPLVLLGTIVSAVGSQSVISGCFAMIDQAITLRVFPTFHSVHLMGHDGHGTYYVPSFNAVLFLGSLCLVVGYQDSETLSGIFGFCVAGAMLITSLLTVLIMTVKWKLAAWRIATYCLVILFFDGMLFIAVCTKLATGAWIACVFAMSFFGLMYAHILGRHNAVESMMLTRWILARFVFKDTWADINHSMDDKFWTMTQVRQHLRSHARVKGLGVFVAYADEEVPHVLSALAHRLPAMPDEVILLSLNCIKSLPFVAEEDRVIFRAVDPANGVYRLLISFGFAERPLDALAAIQRAKKRGLKVKNEDQATFYVSRHAVLPARDARGLRATFRRVKHYLYEVVSRNSNNQVETLGLPVKDVLEVTNVLILL
ncbi:hypothetical protein AMAG_07478 [Allomyces macrogynus ATCC 38327]|uniref:Potassium uptake protein n=1 Tax=Allomyces macrogynus (strain ATCC 38327) TaxID=578462 RepID=A0A0L0SIS2_ALLM3|nr:hypothetical protein AMAG_07478 [Allomyces macrogynus ATCC 38327]|eukprot:KNE62240.1 hypothetical protein AMAG_07478 [Allomyces macrogynus ATCC 38327]